MPYICILCNCKTQCQHFFLSKHRLKQTKVHAALVAEEVIENKAAESAWTFTKRGIKWKEIDVKERAIKRMSWRTFFNTTSCSWVFKSEMRFFESEKMLMLLTCEESAAPIAALTTNSTDHQCFLMSTFSCFTIWSNILSQSLSVLHVC